GPESAEGPVWDQVLEDGDLLYIPRGWRHMVVPLAEPTLHLSFDWRNPTGLDFLRWLQQELHAHPVLSQDLPAAEDAAAQAVYMERVRGELMGVLDQNSLKRFHFMQDAAATARPR